MYHGRVFQNLIFEILLKAINITSWLTQGRILSFAQCIVVNVYSYIDTVVNLDKYKEYEFCLGTVYCTKITNT